MVVECEDWVFISFREVLLLGLARLAKLMCYGELSEIFHREICKELCKEDPDFARDVEGCNCEEVNE